MRRAGVGRRGPVVVYDDAGGVIAARAWWLLRHYGHPAAALLDGGLAAWIEAGGEQEVGDGPAPAGDFDGAPGSMPLLDAETAASLARRGVLLDARQRERFRGEIEPIDPVAGHIPGARNLWTRDNLAPDGRFNDREALRRAFAQVGAGSGAEVGVYCGSGVTAAHEVLALELAGYDAALYVGSWSEWITDHDRPVAVGE